MPVLDIRLVGGNLEQLRNEGCRAAGEPNFGLLLKSTRQNPCEYDCPYFDHGNCPAYLKFHTRAIKKKEQTESKRKEDWEKAHTDQSGLIGGRWAGKSIKKIAQEEGISLNKARENKRAGKYRGDNDTTVADTSAGSASN